MTAGEISIQDFPAYRAQPDGSGPFPVVLVIHEIFGVHPHIQDVCRRFAGLGYLAIAPSLYVRQGDVSQIEDHDEIRKIVSKAPDEQVMRDLDSTAAWAGSNGGDLSRLGVTGFCWGGRTTWLYCAHSSQPKAGVAWYGKVATPATPLQPRRPVDVAGELKCPVLGLYGGADASIPVQDLEPLRHAKGAEIVVYPEAGHGFFADYRPSYNAAAAQDGWRRLQDWFKQHGVA